MPRTEAVPTVYHSRLEFVEAKRRPVQEAAVTPADFARAGKLAKGSKLLYQLAAYLDAGREKPRRGLRIALEPASLEVPLRTGSRHELGVAEAWDNPEPDDFPVLVPRRVLEESVEEARR